MAENQAEATTAEQTEAEPHGDATETTQTEATQPDTEIDWKAQARKWEKLAKANHEKAEQADQLREKAEKADQLQARLDELNAAQAWEKTVGKVSGETGIPVDVLSIVKADSEDKLAEAAKMLQTFIQDVQRHTGMGDQSRQPSEPRPSTEADVMYQVNRNATGA
ncbi:hypothetical protein ACLUWO_04245 [Pseudoscardovia radai]|uniref:hypothetical protein n=1 Tax=Pseudoscardovia radai TaxID=987066 RepID=UPI0039938FA5